MGRLEPSSTSASSSMNRPDDFHPPQHAFDGNPKTAWNEDVRGPGRGEWLQAEFAEARHIARIRIATGYDSVSPRFGDLFSANAHIKRVSVWVDGVRVATRDVEADERSVDLDALDVTGRRVRVVADEVWPGARWQDLSVNEIEIIGE